MTWGGGKIIIDNIKIKRGMIKLGYYRAATYPDTGLRLINNGTIIFKGKCVIGNDCSIVVNKDASVVLGDDFKVNAGLKLTSNNSVIFGSHVLIGWEVSISDTSTNSSSKSINQRGIEIGENNWLSTRSIFFGTLKTPNNCIFRAYSIIKDSNCSCLEPNCLYGGSPLRMLKRNIIRDYRNELITDYTLQS